MSGCSICKSLKLSVYEAPCSKCVSGSEFECVPTIQKKQTNADRIRTMSDEELTKFLNSRVSCIDHCQEFGAGCALKCRHNNGLDVFNNWLKQEATQ